MLRPDRRHSTRLLIRRPSKLFNELTGKYLSAQTCNVSASGAMLTVNRPGRLLPGQHVRVGISTVPDQGIIKAEAMQSARVLRSMIDGERHYVAVAFDEPRILSDAA